MDEHGVPLSIVVCEANRHDSKLLEPLLESRIKPPTTCEVEENLCLDAGYTGKSQSVREKGLVPHIRPRGEEKKLIDRDATFKPRRWIVEVSHSWFNRYRKLVPRYEKTHDSYLALTHLAAALMVLNKIKVIYG